MKVIGLMVTYNEFHFLPYSFPILHELVEETFILDGSTDDTRNYLSQFSNVNVFHEEDYLPMTYKARRQFILDKARDKYGLDNIYIVIDADEIISLELINDLKRIIKTESGSYSVRCNWAHPCQDFEHMAFTWNHQNPRQGIMFRDHGLNCDGNNIVHENKIPYYDKIVNSDKWLIHFGLCNVGYIRAKARLYTILEYIEHKPIHYINLRYFRGIKVLPNTEIYTYPCKINQSIFTIDYNKYNLKTAKLICENCDDLNNLYRLDVWDNEEILKYCTENLLNFEPTKIRHLFRNRTFLRIVFTWNEFVYLLTHGEIRSFYNHFLKVIGVRK